MKKPNRVFAPIIIAGITVGFLASAYKFVFAKAENKKRQHPPVQQATPDLEAQNDSHHS